jgi:predicted DNA-binding ribbon-helix-helix protein
MVETSIQSLARSEHGTRASADRNKISSQGALIQSMDAEEKDSVQSRKLSSHLIVCSMSGLDQSHQVVIARKDSAAVLLG